MDARPPVKRIPWQPILLILTAALLASWGIGFAVGTVVRLVTGR